MRFIVHIKMQMFVLFIVREHTISCNIKQGPQISAIKSTFQRNVIFTRIENIPYYVGRIK